MKTISDIVIKPTLFFIAFIVLISSFAISQNIISATDSIKFILQKTKKIEDRCKLLTQIALKYNESNLDSALRYSYLALSRASRIDKPIFLADSYYTLGVTFKNKGVNDSANFYLFNSLKIYDQLDDFKNVIKTNIAIGEYYRAVHILDQAVKFENKAIVLSKSKKIFKYLPSAYNRLGAIYFELSVNNAIKEAIYADTVFKAISYIDSSNYWSIQMNIKNYNVSNNNLLGACYQNIKKYDKAIEFLNKSLQNAKKNNEIIEMPMIYRNISLNYMKLKHYDKAIEMAKLGVKMADSLGINTSLQFNYYALVLIGEKMNDEKLSLTYLRKKDSVQHIINSEIAIAKTKEFEAKYKNTEKEFLIQQQNAELEKQQQQFVISLIGFAFLGIIIVTGVVFTIRIRKINKLLEVKNKEIESVNNELTKLSQFKDDLTSMIVHDLKNPLNTIINFSKLVNNPETSDITDIKDKNKSIESSAFHMLGIVNNIIDLQKYEDTKISLDSTLNIIENTIKSAVENVNLLLAQKNISVINSISLEYVSEYDNNLIERVIINLLTNAIKFSPNNGRITIDGRVADNFITIKVTDQGKGIPEDKIPQLFNKYARAEIKEIGFSSSSGLGLAFSKLVVNAHGGEIGVDSEYTKGSCFWFTLPTIKKIKLTVKTKPEFSLYLPEFSNNFLRNIAPLRKTLSTFQFYETSEILITIQTYNCNDPEFKTWKTQLENAVLFSNKERFAELIQIEL